MMGLGHQLWYATWAKTRRRHTLRFDHALQSYLESNKSYVTSTEKHHISCKSCTNHSLVNGCVHICRADQLQKTSPSSSTASLGRLLLVSTRIGLTNLEVTAIVFILRQYICSRIWLVKRASLFFCFLKLCLMSSSYVQVLRTRHQPTFLDLCLSSFTNWVIVVMLSFMSIHPSKVNSPSVDFFREDTGTILLRWARVSACLRLFERVCGSACHGCVSACLRVAWIVSIASFILPASELAPYRTTSVRWCVS